jgi:hypothetical protein
LAGGAAVKEKRRGGDRLEVEGEPACAPHLSVREERRGEKWAARREMGRKERSRRREAGPRGPKGR